MKKEKKIKKPKLSSVYTPEEASAIWAAETHEDAMKIIEPKRAVSADEINAALMSCARPTQLTAVIVDMDNKTARLIEQNNLVANRHPKDKNVQRLEMVRQSGEFKINGDAAVIYRGLPLDCGNRLTVAANMPDGETIPMIFLIDPPIADIRHAVLTSTSSAPKSDSDRNNIFPSGEGVHSSHANVAKRHFALVTNVVVSANQYGLLLKTHGQRHMHLINQWADLVFNAAASSVNKKQYSEQAKLFGGKPRLEFLTAAAVFIDERIDPKYKEQLQRYVLSLIGINKYDVPHTSEIVRLNLNSLTNTKKSTAISRDSRTPEIFMRWLIEGFIWHLMYEKTGKYPFTVGHTATSGDWTGIKEDLRLKDEKKSSYKVQFSITADDVPENWLLDALTRLEAIVPETITTEAA